MELCPNLQPYVLTYNHLANEYTPGEHLDAGYQIKGCWFPHCLATLKKKKITQEETNNQDRLNVEYDSVSRGKNTIPHKATQFLNNSLK